MKNGSLVITLVTVLVLLAGVAAGATITFDKSLDIPTRTFTWDNTSYIITNIGNYKLNEPINVVVTSVTGNVLISLYDSDTRLVWSITKSSTDGQVSVPIPSGTVTTSGTYGIVVSSQGGTVGIAPLIISKYDLIVTPALKQISPGSTIKIIVNVSIDGEPENIPSGSSVKIEFVKGTSTLPISNNIAQATSTGVYEANVQIPSSASSGDYNLYAAIVTGKTTMGYPETLGLADGGTITITQSSTAPPADGGGGGDVQSGEDFKNIETREIQEKYLSKDVPASYMFRQSDNPISEIVITSNINAGDITVKTEILRSTSSKVSTSPPGVVYKNLNILVGASGFAAPKNIKEAIIKFKVNNSWIESNNLKDSEIRMIKWDGSKWIELETTKDDKDSSYTYYEARTNAFSTFAIAALKSESASTASTASTVVPLPSPSVTPEITETAVIVITPEELPNITPVLAAGGLVLMAIIAGIYIKRKEIFRK